MALTQIDFSDEEEKIINAYCETYSLNKSRCIKKLILRYKDRIDFEDKL